MKNNTIIFSIRNREVKRIYSLVNSIRENKILSPIIMVDYGSFTDNSEQYKKVCKELKIKYIKTETEGLPWCRSAALNIGIKAAKTQYITTTDVDMIFINNPYEYIYNIENLSKKIIHIETYKLPKSGNFNKALQAGLSSRGGFSFFEKKAFEKIGGYDERMVYWGFEDIDFSDRFNSINYKTEWLPTDQYKIYHIWHPFSETGYLRPSCAETDTQRYFFENKYKPILKQNLGTIITLKNRPILQISTEKKPFIFSVPHKQINNYFPELLNILKTKKYIQVNLSPRIRKSPLKKLQNLLKFLLKHTILKGTGLSCEPDINSNFDTLYSILKILLCNGLIDYYISADFSYVNLLWK